MCGVLSVMTSGLLLMPMWLADSWVTLEQVRSQRHIVVISFVCQKPLQLHTQNDNKSLAQLQVAKAWPALIINHQPHSPILCPLVCIEYIDMEAEESKKNGGGLEMSYVST